ncbi:hypothetical protein E8E13_006318 [Curvularia kusanoi]|uniref:Uncharacterized protein n=1 Tax=Curvularia kusanoi TaxID=90978 RepID=A0A9P4W9Q5_CURKU|nr:hypothetical protein E8E13_006318 [Curvularia kusanoi]
MLEAGSDSILKALLFAKCPRLRDLKFVATAKARRWTCLMVLTKLIKVCVHVSDNANPREDCSAQDTSTDQEAALWPVGFVNIRSVAVGVRSGTFLDDSGYTTDSLWLMHLTRLPNLDSLYINGVCNYHTEPGEPLEKLLPAGSSSVKHIFLDNPDRLEGAVQNAIWAAPKQLLTASIRYENASLRTNAGTAFSKLLRSQSTSLQSTMWYGPEDFDTRVLSGRQIQPVSSYRTFERADIDNLRSTTTIKNVSFYMQDIMKMAINSLDVDELEFVTGLFPESMETLVLVGTLDLTEESSLESLAEWLDLALAKTITCGRYPNLKALYLEGVEKRRLSQNPRFKPWFQKVIAAGGVAGVDVHTLTNRAPMQHSIGFFEAPDKYDLVTGPHKGIRSPDQVFDPYLGHRVSLGCQRCGTCEDCLREYRDFVWEETRA